MKSCRFEMQAWLNVSGKRCRENERLLTFGLMLAKMCSFRLMYRRLDHILDGKFRNLTVQIVILFHCVIKFTSFYFLHVVFFFFCWSLQIIVINLLLIFTEMLIKRSHSFSGICHLLCHFLYLCDLIFILTWSFYFFSEYTLKIWFKKKKCFMQFTFGYDDGCLQYWAEQISRHPECDKLRGHYETFKNILSCWMPHP